MSTLAGPPVGGFIFEATKSYNVSFWMASGVYVGAGVIIVIAGIIQKRRDRVSAKSSNVKPESSDSSSNITQADVICEISVSSGVVNAAFEM